MMVTRRWSMIGLLCIAGMAVRAALLAAPAISEEQKAEFWFPSDPTYELVEVSWIAYSAYDSHLTIYSDGRVVAVGAYRTVPLQAGTYEMRLDYQELRGLIRSFIELGVMDFDPAAVKQKLAERASDPGVRRIISSVGGITRLTVRLPEFRPVGEQEVIEDYVKRIEWRTVKNDAEWSGLDELEGLAEALGILDKLHTHEDLRMIQAGLSK